jgi:hypothetical protein
LFLLSFPAKKRTLASLPYSNCGKIDGLSSYSGTLSVFVTFIYFTTLKLAPAIACSGLRSMINPLVICFPSFKGNIINL